MSDVDALVERYLATWNETDPTARRAAIGGLIGAVQKQFPGFVFTPAGPVDAHHEQVRFTRQLGLPGQPAPIVGFDVAVLADGRVRQVFGFLDKVPAA